MYFLLLAGDEGHSRAPADTKGVIPSAESRRISGLLLTKVQGPIEKNPRRGLHAAKNSPGTLRSVLEGERADHHRRGSHVWKKKKDRV